MKISVICVYNSEYEFQTKLLASLINQNITYELIAINNSNGEYSSAAEALNYGARKAEGDILIFSHQDIYLKTPDALEKLARQIQLQKAGDIIGVQGVRDGSRIYYSNITSGTELDLDKREDFIQDVIEVSSVDEGIFGMLKETWNKRNFEEKLCDDWHLYAVESCLWARENGAHVFVAPIQVHHFSNGIISISYMNGLLKLADRYRKSFKYIWTTCYKVRTAWLYVRILKLIWIINRKIRGRSLF